MPNESEIVVEYSRKVQIEQYEPVTIGASVRIELDDDDEGSDVFDEALDKLEDDVERRIAERGARQKLEE